MNVAIDPYAPPALRVPPLPPRPRMADAQVKMAFPVVEAREYRWRFEDGTRSPWRPAPGRIVWAPPFAEGVEWRKRVVKPLRQRFDFAGAWRRVVELMGRSVRPIEPPTTP